MAHNSVYNLIGYKVSIPGVFKVPAGLDGNTEDIKEVYLNNNSYTDKHPPQEIIIESIKIMEHSSAYIVNDDYIFTVGHISRLLTETYKEDERKGIIYKLFKFINNKLGF